MIERAVCQVGALIIFGSTEFPGGLVSRVVVRLPLAVLLLVWLGVVVG